MAADPPPCFDVFLSHAWGANERNHQLVERVFSALTRLGIKAWFDSNYMIGDIRDAMLEGIDNSMGFVAFITRDYHDKVTGTNSLDNCRIEYRYARNHKGDSKMLVVVLEDAMLNPREWRLPLRELSTKLYAKMTRIDELSDEQLDTLVKKELVPKMTWLPEDVRNRVAEGTGEKTVICARHA